MGFLATFLRLPKTEKRKTSYFRPTIVDTSEKEKRILENYYRQERILMAKLKEKATMFNK